MVMDPCICSWFRLTTNDSRLALFSSILVK
jgi:hypothetical protein